MGAKVITDDLAQELFREYCKGITLKDLENRYGIKRTTIGSAFDRRGLKRGKVDPQRPKQESPDRNCPKDCKFMMKMISGSEMHCGYILFPGNGSRGCDPGAGCTRYEPKKGR